MRAVDFDCPCGLVPWGFGESLPSGSRQEDV
jgi:hypothetical protein